MNVGHRPQPSSAEAARTDIVEARLRHHRERALARLPSRQPCDIRARLQLTQHRPARRLVWAYTLRSGLGDTDAFRAGRFCSNNCAGNNGCSNATYSGWCAPRQLSLLGIAPGPAAGAMRTVVRTWALLTQVCPGGCLSSQRSAGAPRLLRASLSGRGRVDTFIPPASPSRPRVSVW